MVPSVPIRPWFAITLLAGLGLFLFPLTVAANVPRNCAPGIIVKLSAPAPTQGSLLLLEVRSRTALSELTAEWNSRNVPFWQLSDTHLDSKAASSSDVRQAILGVDLEKPPGTYRIFILGESAAMGDPEPAYGAGRYLEALLRERYPKTGTVKLRAIFDLATPEKLWTGGFRVPLDGVTTGGNFGKRRILNGQPGSPHSGVDFPAVTGTPVYAAQNGRVVLAQELFFSGNTVVVDHGLGIYTFYGHLFEIDVRVGDELQSGQILGKVGATGRVTGPHLHWGLTVERARVNPLQLVKLLGSGSGSLANGSRTVTPR